MTIRAYANAVRAFVRHAERKQGRGQVYPLAPVVGQAIARYLKRARPRSRFRELFLKLRAPVGPMTARTLYPVVAHRMKRAGIKAPHRGPRRTVEQARVCATMLCSCFSTTPALALTRRRAFGSPTSIWDPRPRSGFSGRATRRVSVPCGPRRRAHSGR